MKSITCNRCKKPITNNSKFFILEIKEKGNMNSKGLCLKLCSFNCLKEIVDKPELIIIELL